MRKRFFGLVCLLILRCILGWASTCSYPLNQRIKVTGNIVNLYHKDSDCIIVLGNFLINSGNICAAKVGERIEVFGSLERQVIDSFSGRLWLVSKQIDRLDKGLKNENLKTQNRSWVNYFREDLVSVYRKFMPEPEAGLVAGIVLGYKNDIGQNFYQQMIRSGTVHIAVASGYNILLVGGVILSTSFWFMKRSKAIWLALLGMIFYAALAGGEPPVIRAVWMAGLLYLGQALGRNILSWWVLCLTAWVMLMIEPALIASVSFQLSIAASFGLLVVEPKMRKMLDKTGFGAVGELAGKIGLSTTVATMFVTLPIIWWHFGRMSLIAIFSNSLILPLVPLLMILGVGMIVSPVIFSWPTYAVAHWLVLIIQFFGS